jgi:hypothetical protein
MASMTWKSGLLSLLFSFGLAAGLEAATITVCATGCTTTDLQTAFNTAQPGDTILVQTTGVFTRAAGYVLPAKTCPANDATCIITVRAGVTSTGTLVASSSFPAAGIRVNPSTYAAVFPDIVANGPNEPALRTVEPGECASPPCVAKWWHLQWLEIKGNSYGGGALVLLGSWADAAGLWAGGSNVQNLKSEVPHQITLDQVYIHGDAVRGQHRCLQLGADNVIVRNSAIVDCKTEKNDGQAIAGANMSGNIALINNDLSASTETVMFGGVRPEMRQQASVLASPAPSTMGFALNHVTDLSPRQFVGVTHAGVTYPIEVNTVNGTQVTLVSALPFTPSTGDTVNWDVVPANITIQKNLIRKEASWQQPVVGTPGEVSVSPTTGGSLSPGTYYYKIVARHEVNHGVMYRSTASTELVCSVVAPNNACQLSWGAVTNVSTTYKGEYYVYKGTASGAENVRFTVLAPTVTYLDTGASGTSEAVPTTIGNRWSVKNLLELKSAQQVLIEDNVLEYVWQSQQDGYALTLTSLQEGDFDYDNVSAVVRDVTVQYNIIRHASGVLQVSSADASNKPSGVMSNLTLRHNLIYDIGTGWFDSSAAHTMMFTYGDSTPESAHLTRAPANVTIDHNTVLALGNSITLFLIFCNANTPEAATDFKFTNNIIRRQAGGGGIRYYHCTGGTQAEGTVSWDLGTTGPNRSFTKNAFALATGASYPNTANNFFPDESTLQAQFVDYAGGNYRLAGGSAWNNAGTDALDLGADVDTVTTRTATALSGDNSGSTSSTWSDLVETTASGGGIGAGTLRKTGGANGSFDAGALSTATCAADCSFTFTIDQSTAGVRVGLGTNTSPDSTGMTMFIDLGAAGSAALFDLTNSWLLDFNYVVGDTFRVERNGGFLSVYRNGTIVTPNAPGWSVSSGTTRIDVTIQDIGAGITLTGTTGFSGGGSSPIISTTSPLSAGIVGTAYSVTLAATGGTVPYTWSIDAGTLPVGLSLNASTGTISGTPTVSVTAQPVTIRVTDAASATSNKAFTLSISQSLTITSPLFMPSGMAGRAYSRTVTASGGTAPYTWAITAGTLPAGLSLNTSTGAITGTPTTPTTSKNVTLRVTDATAAQASGVFNFRINNANPRRPAYNFSEGAYFVRPEPPVAEDKVKNGDTWVDSDVSPVKHYLATVVGSCPASCTITWVEK